MPRDRLGLLSARGRSHCPCIEIRWGRMFCCCCQRGRTGSSALWPYRSHCRGRARRAGGPTYSPCSEHLVRLSRKSQERGLYADENNIEAHWLDWPTSQKANPPKPPQGNQSQGIKTMRMILRNTERVEFEPTRVLLLHDFESCAINRTRHLSTRPKTFTRPKTPTI